MVKAYEVTTHTYRGDKDKIAALAQEMIRLGIRFEHISVGAQESILAGVYDSSKINLDGLEEI